MSRPEKGAQPEKAESHTYKKWLAPNTQVWGADPDRLPSCGSGTIPPNVQVLVETVERGWPRGPFAHVMVNKVNGLAVSQHAQMGPQTFSIGGLTLGIGTQCFIRTAALRR